LRRFSQSGWLGVVVCAVAFGCASKDNNSQVASELAAELERLNGIEAASVGRFDDSKVPTEIAKFCGDCHALPRPSSFVREVWYEEIEKGYEFYARSGRTDLNPPPLQSVVKFYRKHAPAVIEFPRPADVAQDQRKRFELESFDWRDSGSLTAAIASIRWVNVQPKGEGKLVTCDMRDGSISLIAPNPKHISRQVIGRLGNPARATACDLNADGLTDFAVAELASFNPYDHAFGKVVWLKKLDSSDGYEAITLKEGLGRVADVAVADFSSDGLQDILVAEFGHRKTGGIHLLTRLEIDPTKVEFQSKKLDIRPGTMQAIPHDWNHDGKMDFASITSQEFECVDLFLNNDTAFNNYNLWNGTDLTTGSIGIELADLDRDGDQDILCVNGDSFDNNFANRSHGVQWLENLGELQFKEHRIVELPGAYRAVAGDMDRDGDLDIIAVANLPTTVYPNSLLEANPVSIMMLEQTSSRNFTPHVLERGTPRYPALEVGDFNSDGMVDFVVGTQLFDTDPPGSPAANLPRLKFWWQKQPD
jgi:FG-GAP-like repeat